MGKVGGGYLVFSKCRVMRYCLADIKLPVEKYPKEICVFIELHLLKIVIKNRRRLTLIQGI